MWLLVWPKMRRDIRRLDALLVFATMVTAILGVTPLWLLWLAGMWFMIDLTITIATEFVRALRKPAKRKTR